MFDSRITYLNVGSYLCMIPKKAFSKAERYKKDKYFSGLPGATESFYSNSLLCGQTSLSGGLSGTEDISRATQI